MRDVQLYTLYHSTNPAKKYDIYVRSPSGGVKKVSFGAKGYEDYTMHRDKARRENYRSRHQHDRIDDPTYPGFWSWWVLWGDSPDLETALRSTIRRFGLKK